MDRGWFIGYERIPRTKSEEQLSSTFSGTSRPCRTIKLTEMLRADQPDAVKKPVPIRPPSPRAPQLRGQERHSGLSCEPTHKAISHSMDRRWFIGHERILPSKSEEQTSSFCNSVSRPCMTIKLTEMLRADQPNAIKKPVPIRPPSLRAPQPRVQELHRSLSCEPTPKPIIRQRSHSLPSPTEKKKHCRNVGVRFVDSLGVDLEDIRLFRSGEDPFVPHHVTFRLLMGAELADGRHQEISLPYLKPVFAQQPGDQPGFLHRLHEQKVCLERVLCFELGVIGITQVLNLGFEKDVTARYSFTEWKSCTETKASWVSTVNKTWEGGGGQLSCDTFRFHLPVPPVLQPGAVLQFAIQYKVCGAEYWDNNDGENYKLVCHNYKLTVPKECEDSMLHFI